MLAALLVMAGCSRADPASIPKPPHQLDNFDGVSRSHLVTANPLQIDPGPDSAALFNRAIDCYPVASWFRPEISAELRAGARTYTAAGDYITPGGSVVMKIPLYSALEVERERERESQRRMKMADAVGQFLEALVQYRLVGRELELMRGIEARAQARVAAGVAETAEQLTALRTVSTLENKRIEWLAKITTARLQLIGQCTADQAPGLDTYLRRFQPLEPGLKSAKSGG